MAHAGIVRCPEACPRVAPRGGGLRHLGKYLLDKARQRLSTTLAMFMRLLVLLYLMMLALLLVPKVEMM